MKIISQSEEVLTRRVTTIDLEDGAAIVVLDYLNDDKNIVDSVYRDADTGVEIDDPRALEVVEAFMAEQEFSE
jgi:hypothetical protein